MYHVKLKIHIVIDLAEWNYDCFKWTVHANWSAEQQLSVHFLVRDMNGNQNTHKTEAKKFEYKCQIDVHPNDKIWISIEMCQRWQ